MILTAELPSRMLIGVCRDAYESKVLEAMEFSAYDIKKAGL